MIPDLPRFPKLPKRLTSSELDGSIVIPSGSVALRESKDIQSLLVDRSVGKELSIALDSPIVRYHGCRHCPHYGSSFCFEKIVPPALYSGGICSGRLNEVLDIVELNGSTDGLKIRKTEVMERLRKHIVLLENDFADYRLKRADLLPDLKAKVLTDSEGDPIPVNDVIALNAADAERELKLAQLDSYQMRLLHDIEVLSLKFAELVQADEKLSTGEKITISLSPLSVGRLIRESKSKVIDI